MLIQCQACNSKYRLNLERIPNRKTFIKCKKCNAPIYIDPQDDLGQDAAFAQPLNAAAPDSRNERGMALVMCTNCEARYRVPAEQLARPGLTLKCSSCGTKFPVPESFAEQEPPAAAEEAAEEMAEEAAEEAAMPSPDFFPSAMPPADAGRENGGAETMPLPDDARVSSMFDDLQVNLDDGRSSRGDDPTAFDPSFVPPPKAPGSEPERAYLEAVSIFEDGAAPSLPKRGTLPDDQKYRFFMKPNSGDDEGGPAASNAEEPVLPSLDEQQPPARQAAAGERGEPMDLPPLPADDAPDDTPDDVTPLGGGGMGHDPALPAIREEPEARGPNPPVPEQEIPKEVENRRFRMLLAAVAVLALVSAGWGAWLGSLPGSQEGYLMKEGTPPELAIKTTKPGYFIINKPSGEKLYVLTGEIENGFATSDGVGWIRLKGTAYANGQPTRVSHSYLGNLLNDNQLATWALPAIRAYYGYINGRDDGNFQIAQGGKVPFQIVLQGVRQPVERVAATLVSYRQKGRPVYLEQYP